MENTASHSPTKPIDSLPSSPIQSPLNPKSNTPLIVILVILLITSLGAGSYYFLQYQELLNTPQLLPTPIPSTSSNKPPLKTDLTSNWETYVDKGISFKYSPSWKVTTLSGDVLENGETINTSITLKKDNATISMLLNISGIGGKGQDLNGEAYTFDGAEIYKYKDFSESDKSVAIGLTNRLEASLGVFEHKGKTYSFRLTYPRSLDKQTSEALEKEFDQILSTFKFTKSQPDLTTNTWKTYTNTKYSYTLRYPEGWVVDDSKADDASFAPIEISKDKHLLTITYLEGFGPGLCLFDDQSRTGAPEFASFCEGAFVKLNNGMRRRLEKPVIQNNAESRWTIYTKEGNGDYFVTVPPITYTTPIDYEPELIKVMDTILESYSSTK